jgi:hypothetical protein
VKNNTFSFIWSPSEDELKTLSSGAVKGVKDPEQTQLEPNPVSVYVKWNLCDFERIHIDNPKVNKHAIITFGIRSVKKSAISVAILDSKFSAIHDECAFFCNKLEDAVKHVCSVMKIDEGLVRSELDRLKKERLT